MQPFRLPKVGNVGCSKTGGNSSFHDRPIAPPDARGQRVELLKDAPKIPATEQERAGADVAALLPFHDSVIASQHPPFILIGLEGLCCDRSAM
jgi:hypothetical protein